MMMNTASIRQLNEQVQHEALFLQDLLAEINKVMVGHETLVERVLIALLADGHILLEGVPGLAKTLLVKTMAQAIQSDFSRIQFTPDLLPADLVGTQIYNPKSGEFAIHQGPLFLDIPAPGNNIVPFGYIFPLFVLIHITFIGGQAELGHILLDTGNVGDFRILAHPSDQNDFV